MLLRDDKILFLDVVKGPLLLLMGDNDADVITLIDVIETPRDADVTTEGGATKSCLLMFSSLVLVEASLLVCKLDIDR